MTFFQSAEMGGGGDLIPGLVHHDCKGPPDLGGGGFWCSRFGAPT